MQDRQAAAWKERKSGKTGLGKKETVGAREETGVGGGWTPSPTSPAKLPGWEREGAAEPWMSRWVWETTGLGKGDSLSGLGS